MISRRSLLLLAAAAAGALAAAPALAAERFDYTPGAFDAALSAGKPILVWIRASWRPTCKAQASTETGRSVGDTDPASIAALVAKAG